MFVDSDNMLTPNLIYTGSFVRLIGVIGVWKLRRHTATDSLATLLWFLSPL